MNKLLLKFFENRGYGKTEKEINEFIQNLNKVKEYDLSILNDYVECLHEHTWAKIVVLTDFDTDGIMAGVIGYDALRRLGFKVELYYPDTKRGYGFSQWDIEKIMDELDPDLIITGDVGITAFDAVDYAKSTGVEMLITDHHTCGEHLPNADMVLNPKMFKNGFSYRDICGATVMWYLMYAYSKAYGTKEDQEYVNALKVFTGFSTVSDSMPVYSENRQYILETMNVLKKIYDDNSYVYHEGEIFTRLNLLVTTFVKANKVRTREELDEDFFGFYVAPTLNSLKRMGGDIKHAYNIFFADKKKALSSLLFLMDLSKQRKELVESKYKEILGSEQPYKPYIYVTDAHGGICGLLAQKLMDYTGKPTLVVHKTDSGYSGSGRSYSWFPYLEFAKDKDFFAAGHNEAFGTRIEADKLEYVYRLMAKEVQLKEPEDKLEKADFIISTMNDGDTGIDIPLFEEFVQELENLKPFGQGFPAPVFEFKFEPSKAKCFKMGKNKEHVKYIVNGFPVIFFYCEDMGSPRSITVRGKFSVNEFNGNRTLQLIV